MNLRRNELRASATATLLVLGATFLVSSLSAQTNQRNLDGQIEIISRIVLANEGSFCIPNANDSVLLLICGGDTLQRGRDYAVRDSIITLSGAMRGCDTLKLIRLRNCDLVGKRYALHEFHSTSDSEEPESLPMPENTPVESPVTTSNLKVSGTKSFYADVSDNGRTNLSQGLTMSLAGDIGRGIIVKGSFSDRGLRDDRMITKRFSELDNVYLEVESQHLGGVFGSYQLHEERFRYLTMNRNVQGLGVKYRAGNAAIESSVSVPPGNFGEYNFVTFDGFYGPYRLQGKNGEAGIAVIENSETVWLNGTKLSRGKDQDYYLDYPRGELYFTGRVASDNQDRVRVDFEYQRLEYHKTLVTGAITDSTNDGKLKLGLGYAGSVSAKNDPVDFALNDSDIAVLQAAGDDAGRAGVPGARFVGSGNGDYVVQMDSLSDTIYVYVGSRNGDRSVTFSRVERGDYIYLGGGRYQFVGRARGDHLPVRILPLPEAAHVTAFKSEFAPITNLRLSGEVGLSVYDRNRFSERDDGDNTTAAGSFGVAYVDRAQRIKSNISAEYLPGGFARLGRLDNVDESYLWQRQSQQLSDRQRYLGDLTMRLGRHDRSRIEAGYTSEKSGFESKRVGVSTQLMELARSTVGVDFNFSLSRQTGSSNRLLAIKPSYRLELNPIVFTAKGDFDNRKVSSSSMPTTYSSKREAEMGVAHAGLSLVARQRENWQKVSAWKRLDRKQALVLSANRIFAGRRKVDLNVALNRYGDVDNKVTTYQTGQLNLDLSRFASVCDLGANLRLSRRGSFQTNKSYLKVEDGKGNYVLIDSVYVPQAHGNYISVTEQVGALTPSVEVEKRVQIDIDLEKIAKNPIMNGTTIRYETNLHEIGNDVNRFQLRWLAPPLPYFAKDARFRRRNDEYRLVRYDRAIGLRSEGSYNISRERNLLDVSRPQTRNSERLRLLFNRRVRERDYVELVGRAENVFDQQFNRYSLTLRKRSLTLAGTHYQQRWEIGATLDAGREKTDSLSLRATTLRLTPKASYNLAGRGRVETSVFLLHVSERAGKAILLQMADGFPTGTHVGGTILIDFSIAANFSFRLTGQGEIRDGEKDRYFLRSELVSRFQ